MSLFGVKYRVIVMNNFTLTLLICIFLTGLAYAHPESGHVPDSIAETEYEIAIDLDSEDIKTRYKFGILLLRKGKLNEARKQFEEVIRIKPDDFHAHEGIGLVLMKERDYKDAESWFKKAVSIDSKDEMVYYHLGSVYRMMGKNAEAIEMYKKSLELKENPGILTELGELKDK